MNPEGVNLLRHDKKFKFPFHACKAGQIARKLTHKCARPRCITCITCVMCNCLTSITCITCVMCIPCILCILCITCTTCNTCKFLHYYYAQMITMPHGGGSLGTHESDYVICAPPLISLQSKSIIF